MVQQQDLPSLPPTPVRAAAEYWSVLGRISAANSSEDKTAGCFKAKLFLALDVAHEVTSPFHTELGTRPWASHPAAGFTKSQIVAEGLFVGFVPLLGGCCSWHQLQVKQSQVTFPSGGVSAVWLVQSGLGLIVNHIWEGSKNIPKHLITWFPLSSHLGSRGSCCPVCPQAVPVQG